MRTRHLHQLATTLVVTVVLSLVGCSHRQGTVHIVSPQRYAAFDAGAAITAVADATPDADDVAWRVLPLSYTGSDDTLFTGTGATFTFTPPGAGNYDVIATASGGAADTVVVLVRAAQPPPAPWTQVSLTTSLDGLVEASFGFARLVVSEGEAPVTTGAGVLSFDVGQPLGSTVAIHVDAVVVDSTGALLGHFVADTTHAFVDATIQEVAVPLYPGAINRIRFEGSDPQPGTSSPVFFTIIQTGGPSPQPGLFRSIRLVRPASPRAYRVPVARVAFSPASTAAGTAPRRQQAPPPITEAQLQAALKRFIDNAKHVSRELAGHLGDVVLHNGGSGTDRTTGRIRISRNQLRDTLRQIAAERDAGEKARMQEELKRVMVGLLLHEAGHSKAVKAGTAGVNTPEPDEEIRNITELINRMIDLLGRLNQRLQDKAPNVAPDGGGLDGQDASTWFDRVQAIILGQMRYVQKFLRRKNAAFKNDTDALQAAFNRLKQDLKAISQDGTKTADQKRQAAQARFNTFKTAVAPLVQRIAQACGKVYEFHLDPRTGAVRVTNKAGDRFKDKAIPPKARRGE